MLIIQIDTKSLGLVICHQFNNIKLSLFTSHKKSSFPFCTFDRCCTVIRYSRVFRLCCWTNQDIFFVGEVGVVEQGPSRMLFLWNIQLSWVNVCIGNWKALETFFFLLSRCFSMLTHHQGILVTLMAKQKKVEEEEGPALAFCVWPYFWRKYASQLPLA